MGKNNFNIEKSILLSVIVASSLLVALILIFAAVNFPNYDFPAIDFGNPPENKLKDIKKFSSEDDFKNYLAASSGMSSYYGGLGTGGAMMDREMAPMNIKSANGTGGGEPQRVSDTNVQVIGIDEPDIVKTDGKEIYFSGQPRFYPMTRELIGNGENKIMSYPYPAPQAETKVIKAFPPADLAIDGKIDKQGDLLLDKNILTVFSNSGYYGTPQEIFGYDISNSKSPAKKWNIKLDNNTFVVTSRFHNGKIYLIVRNNINTLKPCPIKPLSIGDLPITIPCGEIYHPIVPVPIDSTFTAMVLDPTSGVISEKVSFVGSSGQSVVYVSENAIYATYAYNESIVKFFSGFIKENKNLFPSWLAENAAKLESYDISEGSKISELTAIFQKYQNSLNEDERLKVQNELENRMSEYYKKHKRDWEKTGIIRVDLEKLQITASGSVPGHLLNNFSMDEYQGNLRIAATIGSRWGGFNGIGRDESVSDVYILDKNLKIIGSVQDLGKTEQIYSARFVEDKGYIVTFRQTDPFYVIDLANPKNPKMAGELKIPGYSSYLHPLDATHILGIGMEGSKVKISLFDVSDKNNPAELDKYMLDEYWTEVANNYHAFLLDTKHNIFFLPGSKGGYVFSYFYNFSDRECKSHYPPQECTSLSLRSKLSFKLSLQKAISQNSVKRAIYINDYLYIIGEDKITVLNEADWEKVNELSLQ
jgi:inhibitor of cysteine peptidase